MSRTALMVVTGRLEGLAAFGRIARLAFRDAYGWLDPWVYTLFLMVRPATQVIFFGLVARFATGSNDVSFQLIGNAVQVCALSSLGTTADVLVNERANGTLALVTLAARNRFMTFAGRLLVVGMHGLVTSAGALAVGVLLFDLNTTGVAWGWLGLTLVVTVFATSALGVALGSIGLVLTDLNLVGNLVSTTMMAICGINFAVSLLPTWLQTVAYALPMTRGADAARLAFAGGGQALPGLLLGEVAVGVTWLLAGYALLGWMEWQARVNGTMDLY
jgi:ABC-2 type transport system permease protein